MSLPLHGQQGIQRSVAAALRFKSSTSLHKQGVAAEADTSANSTPKHSCDISEEISLYDLADVDPFKYEPCAHSSSFGHIHDVGLSDNSSFSVSPAIPSPTSSTESLAEMTETLNVIDCHQEKNCGVALSSPEILALKQKTVSEHNEIQRKIRRIFELVMNGGHHLKEMMTLTKDIENHFEQAPGIITDSELGSDESIYSSSPSSSPEETYSRTGYPFPIMPSPQSPSTLGLITEDDETLVSDSPNSTFETNATPPMTPAPAEQANKPSKIPRFRLPPLLIVKTPSLASISSYTLSPTPLQKTFRPPQLARSFSAPLLFGGREKSSAPTPAEKAIHSAKARMSYIPVKKGTISDLPSPKIKVKFDFEPPDDPTPSPTTSRFSSSSSLIPTAARDRWFKPKFNLRYSRKGWRAYKWPSKPVIANPPVARSRPLSSVFEHVQLIPRDSSDDKSHARFKRSQLGRPQNDTGIDSRLPVTASGRWSTDWAKLLAKIGNEGDNGECSEAAMVLHAAATMDSLNAPEPPLATALLLPRGPAQIRKASSRRSPVRSHWRVGGFFGGGSSSIPSLPTKATFNRPSNTASHDPSFSGDTTPAVPIKKPVECQVHLPSILSVLDDAVDSKKSNGVVRMLSMASKMSRTSLLGPKGKMPRSSLIPKQPLMVRSTTSLPRIRSSSGSHLSLHRTARLSRESRLGDILDHFPEPPLIV